MSKKTSKTKRRNTNSNRGEIKMSVKDWFIEKLGIAYLKPLYEKLEGKKTYIIMAVAILFAGIDTWNALCGEQIVTSWCNDINIPPYVFGILAALGIYTRAVAKPK